MNDNIVDISVMVGQIATRIQVDDDEACFFMSDGSVYSLRHLQDCCESVTIEDVIGEIQDLIDSPILLAEEVMSEDNPPDITKEDQMSFTWTFYKFATVKGYVTIRWYGESNGYYSESVSFVKLK